jgi:hypothetical protein
MAAINAGDKATLAQIDGPVEVVADRIIAENRDRTDSEKK